ncbi:tetraspanin-6-like [Centruroides sculpturatus]|uniref:tetraspanin-6-like n=1 Tax=Centruroides sculpturatus TaxID=218467 RepID=UPI000C6E2182|nr:tetraspanin-6-like [Centruroides sculpturatus]
MAKQLQTGLAVFCMKGLLLIFNCLFWVSGIALLVAGIWMKITMTQILKLSVDYSNSVPFSFIGIGILITIIGFLACFCTVKGHSTLLYLLSIFLIVVFFMEVGIAVAGYAFRNNIRSALKDGIKKAVDSYENDGNQDRNIDFVQKNIKCCGVENYEDWFFTTWANGSKKVPKSCCKFDNCQNNPANKTQIYTEGCYPVLINDIHNKMGIIAGVAVSFACIQLLGAILTCCLAKRSNAIRYQPMT